ncbi:hypothetical protein [Roseibacillus ishigakijimensis]|uniref:Uncharacterized protein n=1 Tax=Roseibacillus ishigakijimensis TaxID=454146 RepID=A0A934VK23_9BACT|nr:hypothetical protein [Roseibacillus ishigakijimensis]MBK1833209.1 hypothetical protein [Roseibacillus ishigakijimensis]
MKKGSSLLVLVILALTGFGSGWIFRQASSASKVPSMAGAAATKSHRARESARSAATTQSPQARGGAPTLPPIQSPDTAEDIHALPASQLYDRMALFLLDLPAEEFPAFYSRYLEREDRNNDLNDLLFMAWTRVDPAAAILATKDTNDSRYAWWAWAGHDPEAALQATLAGEAGPDPWPTFWGIGEFHPQWALENWDRFPEENRRSILNGLSKWPDSQTPEASYLLTKKGNRTAHSQTLLALAREDPSKAYDLIKEHGLSAFNHSDQSELDRLIEIARRFEPEILSDLSQLVKGPSDKNRLAKAHFESLLAEEPEAARQVLEETPEGWLKQDMVVAYGEKLLREDPQAGIDFAVKALANSDLDPDRTTWFHYNNGTSGKGGGNNPIPSFLDSLLSKDPAQLMSGLASQSKFEPNRHQSNSFTHAAQKWANHNLNEFAEWTTQQKESNPQAYEASAGILINQLNHQNEFAAAMAWSETLATEPEHQQRSIYHRWLRSDPEAAMAWRQSPDFKGNPDHFPLPEATEEP